MALPNLSKLMCVARMRYIQSIHEPPARRNPDTLVGQFIPTLERWRTAWFGYRELPRLRAEPFYHYLLARTRHYDGVLEKSVRDGARTVVFIGCGSDTRSQRFGPLLRDHGVKVVECDLAEAIHAKEELVRRRWPSDHVEYLAVDLNDEEWPDLARRLVERSSSRALVMLEGVSPYVNSSNFRGFLRFLTHHLTAGSRVAYDFKLQGVHDDFGRVGRTLEPFRLPSDKAEVARVHGELGLNLEHMELSKELCGRLLGSPDEPATCVFEEDGLVTLRVSS
jgi:methyltransferase (TIGR00027 family)